MRRCDEHEADVQIDDVFYRFDHKREFSAMKGMSKLKGVRFFRYYATEERLEAERREALRQRRKAMKGI